MAQVASVATIDAAGLSVREINIRLRELVSEGAQDIRVLNPAGRHSLAVALKAAGVRVTFEGPVGWYCAGMNRGATVIVQGNCGWGVAECMMDGRVEVHGNAGSGAGASIRGGIVYVAGDAGARAGISMKGGVLVVGGDAGYMSGFMMQRGVLVVRGDVADGVGDSMYEGAIYVGGRIASLGADAEEREVGEADRALLRDLLEPLGIDPEGFAKIVSGRRLWNFSTKEPELWRTAL